MSSVGANAAGHSGDSSSVDSVSGAPDGSKGTGQAAASADDQWAVAQLSASGEEVVGVLARPQYLLLALTVLLPPLGVQFVLNTLYQHLPHHQVLWHFIYTHQVF